MVLKRPTIKSNILVLPKTNENIGSFQCFEISSCFGGNSFQIARLFSRI